MDSLKVLKEINKQAKKNERTIDCLLQVHIAEEETKFGLSEEEVEELLHSREFTAMSNVRILGLMGMGTYDAPDAQLRKEFGGLHQLFEKLKNKAEKEATMQGTFDGDEQRLPDRDGRRQQHGARGQCYFRSEEVKDDLRATTPSPERKFLLDGV